jgi:hypothetical protein
MPEVSPATASPEAVSGNPYLVGGLEDECYDFPYIGNFITPTDELHHVSEGWRKTTNHISSELAKFQDKPSHFAGSDLFSRTRCGAS